MPVDLSIKLPKKQYKKESSNVNPVHNFDSTIDESEKLEIPIVAYPPFKLRSSMYDKDPLIWANLLLTYIDYMKFIYSIICGASENSRSTSGDLDGEVLLSQKLSENTIIETKKFIRKYLEETSYEMDQILTLGGVNVDISDRNVILRNLVFVVVEKLGLLYFEINGQIIWDLIKVYGKGNCFKIREMILYPIRVNDKADVESSMLLNSLQNYLEQLIIDGKLSVNSHSDIEFLAILLGLNNKLETTNKKQSNNKKEEFFQKKRDKFISKFVDLRWIQMLERYYGDGSSIHSDICKILMLMSLIGCTIDHLTNLINQFFERFELTSAKDFAREFKLFSAIINDEYTQSKLTKGNESLLASKLGKVLRSYNENTNEEVEQILSVFPHFTSLQVRKMLKMNKGKPVHILIDELLENPDRVEQLLNSTDKPDDKKTISKEKFNPKNVILGKKKQLKFNDINSKEIYDSDDNKLRKKTLELSLSLIYNNDEDEPDDTYVDAEITQSEALANTSSNKTNEELKNQFIKQENLQNIEMYLYTLYTRNPSVADRSAESRRGKLRKEIIDKTGWSNEQIEGWFYMLNKDHNKKSNLESLLILNRGEVKLMNMEKKGSGQDKKQNSKENDDSKKKDDPNAKRKQIHQQKRKTQNKSKVGNHNRKREHSKKMAQVM